MKPRCQDLCRKVHSTTVNNLLFCAYTLCISNVSIVVCARSTPKVANKNIPQFQFVGFHNHCSSLIQTLNLL